MGFSWLRLSWLLLWLDGLLSAYLGRLWLAVAAVILRPSGLLWLPLVFLGIVAGRVPAVVVVVVVFLVPLLFRLAVILQDGPGRLLQACKLRS